MTQKLKVAAAQMEPQLMQIEGNLQTMERYVKEASSHGVQLLVFPECSLTGYMFDSREEAVSFAESVPGPGTERMAAISRSYNVHVAFGLLERADGWLFNTVVLLAPDGDMWSYRKTHLPFQGVDRFVDMADGPFEVCRTPLGMLGLQICYDAVFPESSRILSLQGAELLVVAANFPSGPGERICSCVLNARAFENKVHVVACNRIGSERGAKFCGLSKIVKASSDTLAQAGPDREELVYGELNLESARRKQIVFSPGEWEVNQMRDRRPELYGPLTETGGWESGSLQ